MIYSTSLFQFDDLNIYYIYVFIRRMIFARLEYITLFINFNRNSVIACRHKF